MDKKKAEQLDILLKKLKDRRNKGRLLKKGEIVELLGLNGYEELIVLKTILSIDGYIDTPTKDTIGSITDEGIAFIAQGGYSSRFKKFQSMYIFISYSSEDKADAEKLAKILKDYGVDYFLDSKDVKWGDNFSESIDSALSECTDLVVIISPASLQSQWVPYEIGSASALKKKILPYLTHPSLLQSLPFYLQRFQCMTRLQDVKSYFES